MMRASCARGDFPTIREMRICHACFFLLLVTSSLCCRAWDYAGHRIVNLLALSSLPQDFPAFVRSPATVERIAFLAGEPDRWRNTPELSLRHLNGPDHFFDMEWLRYAEIAPENLSEFRYIFVEQLARARRAHPERFPVIEPDKNTDETRQLAGFLPWTIVEYYAKVRSAFSYLKAFEENGTPDEIANAQANAIYVMGVMGHYVGDGSQPLHLTENYNGWAQPQNPRGYTTAKTFHAWIDGGFFNKTGGLSYNALAPYVRPAILLKTHADFGQRNPIFSATLTYLLRQYSKVSAVYELEKTGRLSPAQPKEGRAFLDRQLVEGAEMLGSLWYTAWRDAAPDPYIRATLIERKLKQESN